MGCGMASCSDLARIGEDSPDQPKDSGGIIGGENGVARPCPGRGDGGVLPRARAVNPVLFDSDTFSVIATDTFL